MKSHNLGIAALFLATLILPVAGADAAVRYVASSGSGGGGQNWATAYKTIQAAIDDPAMTAGGEIRVKQGTYMLAVAITVAKAVNIYGGYSGVGETRDPGGFPTILDSGGNARHAFDVSADAVIDGFTMTGGEAWGLFPGDKGGGMLIENCAATVRNCTFTKNNATNVGGGIAAIWANGTRIINCTFRENTASYGGAGLYVEGFAGIRVEGCTFTMNTTERSGGGILNNETDTTIVGCRFTGNETGMLDDERGGGILNNYGAPTVSDCLFEENLAGFGAGVCNQAADAIIEDCTFVDCDRATIGGGGLYNLGGLPTVSRCLFRGNEVVSKGGAVLDQSEATYVNCVMWDNSTMRNGGAVYIDFDEFGIVAAPVFINCTLSGNRASNGGALYSYNASGTLRNCILWGNTAVVAGPGIHNYTLLWNVETIADYCNIEGSQIYPGTGNIRVDPLFEGPASGDFRLSGGSPCVDTGSNVAIGAVAEDYAGNLRVTDGNGDAIAVVDMGAYEAEGPPPVTDHVFRGEIMQGMIYDQYSDSSATYAFTLLLETDGEVDHVEFQAPGNNEVHSIQTYETQGAVRIWEYWVEFDNAGALAAYGDGIYQITARLTSGSNSTMDVAFTLPGSGTPIPQPMQKPHVLSPLYDEGVESPVNVTWEACADAGVNTIFLMVSDGVTGTGVVADTFGKTTTSSDVYALGQGTYSVELGFGSLHDAPSTDGTPFHYGKVVLVGHRFEVTSATTSPIYRFWSASTGSHFYTADAAERDHLIDNWSSVWTYENTAFSAYITPSDAGLVPVYRFWSPVGGSHFYTIYEDEKDWLIAEYPDFWNYEDIAFYAYPEGAQPVGSKPVFRFWKHGEGKHFYTMSEEERDWLIEQFSYLYTYEDVAFYAYP